MIEGFICEKCSTPFLSKEEAIACELNHKVPLSIKSCSYSRNSIGYKSSPCPLTVIVKFSEEHGDYAIYTFSHYGIRGV